MSAIDSFLKKDLVTNKVIKIGLNSIRYQMYMIMVKNNFIFILIKFL